MMMLIIQKNSMRYHMHEMKYVTVNASPFFVKLMVLTDLPPAKPVQLSVFKRFSKLAASGRSKKESSANIVFTFDSSLKLCCQACLCNITKIDRRANDLQNPINFMLHSKQQTQVLWQRLWEETEWAASYQTNVATQFVDWNIAGVEWAASCQTNVGWLWSKATETEPST